MALGIQRRDEIISMTGRAIGKLPGAGKMEQDAIKVGEFSQLGQGFHGAIQGVATVISGYSNETGLAGQHHDDCQIGPG